MLEDECSTLLQAPPVAESPQSPRSFPLLFLLFSTLGLSLTLTSHCLMDRPSTCLPDLALLPFFRPYLFQVLLM